MTLNRFQPPPRSFFEKLEARGHEEPLGVDIGGLIFHLEGADAQLREALRDRYQSYPAGEGIPGFRIQLLDGERDHFVAPEQVPADARHPLSLDWEGKVLLIRSFGFAGWADLEAGKGGLALASSEYEKALWCVENYLRVSTAWLVLAEGGVLLHGAGVVKEGWGHVFVGASGSGKSTLAAMSRQGEVVSDDLSLVRKRKGKFLLAGTPFRGTYRGGRAMRGDFPIGGIYRIFQAKENRLEPCPRNRAVADLLAASPFVVDQIRRDGRIFANLKRLDSAHPLAYLHFNLTGDFWDAIPSAHGHGRKKQAETIEEQDASPHPDRGKPGDG